MTNEKTYSVYEASKLVDCSRAIVSRLCQRGLIGTRYDFPGDSGHIYRLNDADIAVLQQRKNDWESRLQKKSAG